jgi:hypothetical protein
MDTTPRQLAWVESPLQLIAAAEFAAAQRQAVDVALRVGPQMAETAERLIGLRALFSAVVPYIGIPWGMLASRRSWLIGDGFSGQFQTAMATLGARSVTLLDDGMMTIHLARSIAGAREYARPGVRTGGHRALLASLTRDRMLALAARERLSFFTAFAEHDALRALADAAVPVTENAFAWLRSSASPVTLPGSTVVLGAAAVADARSDAETYLRWVRGVARSVGAPVAYLPHRREPAGMLRAVDGIPGVTVVRTGIPVELALAGTDRTLDIVTLPSTAAVTLRAVLAGTGSTIRTHELRERVR